MIVSLIFVFSSVVSILGIFNLSPLLQYNKFWQGGISGAVANIYLTDKFGFGKVSGALRNGHFSVNFNAVR